MLPVVKEIIDRRGRHLWYLKANRSAKWERIQRWWVTVALRNRMVRLSKDARNEHCDS